MNLDNKVEDMCKASDTILSATERRHKVRQFVHKRVIV